MRLGWLGLLLAAPAFGQSVVPPDAFEALSVGRTFHFSLAGEPFGAEQYLPGRRTLWQFRGGTCVAGAWEPRGDALCFTYEGDAAAQCWQLRDGPEGMSAHLLDDGAAAGFRLEVERVDEAPLPCTGSGMAGPDRGLRRDAGLDPPVSRRNRHRGGRRARTARPARYSDCPAALAT